jgi:hypothetical protein
MRIVNRGKKCKQENCTHMARVKGLCMSCYQKGLPRLEPIIRRRTKIKVGDRC